MALPSSRVPPVKTCPALRPRWCPAHSPSRTQDCCLPARANRRLPTTIHISGLNHAAYLLATPGSVRPLTGRHAGSLLTGWLGVSQVGLEPEVLTYWATTTNFIGCLLLPRFRAYLGASTHIAGRLYTLLPLGDVRGSADTRWLSTGGRGVIRIQNCCNTDALNLSFRLFPTTQHPPQWPSMRTKRGSACARSTSIELPTLISLMVSIGEMMQQA